MKITRETRGLQKTTIFAVISCDFAQFCDQSLSSFFKNCRLTMDPRSKNALKKSIGSPRFPRKVECHANEERTESEQARDFGKRSSEQVSSVEIVLCDDGHLKVETQSKTTLNKSWSPRFIRKGNCHEESSSSKQKSGGSSSEHPSQTEIVPCDDGLLSVQSPSKTALKKSGSPRFLRKGKCHEESSSSNQMSGSSTDHPSNPEIVPCDDGLLSVESPSENASRKKSWSPRFLRKRECYDNAAESDEEEMSASELRALLGGSKHRRNAICTMLMTADYFRAFSYLQLLGTLSGTDLI